MKSTTPAGALALVAFASMLAGGTPGVSAQGGQVADAPTLADILAAASRYVAEFRDQLSGIVAEERYRQRAGTPTRTARGFFGSREQRRELRSDLLLVRPRGADRFVEFRDVFEVDGRPVRDRQERLVDLFLSPTRSALSQMQAITVESARYNLGLITRTLNTPTLALALLSPDYKPRVTFARTTDTTPSLDLQMDAQGHSSDVWVVEFAENGVETLVSGQRGTSLPAEGRFWIEAASGAVVASELVVKDPDVSALVDVRYALEPDLGVRVPVEMRERYSDRSGSRVEGTASYSNFRQFQVEVDEGLPDKN